MIINISEETVKTVITACDLRIKNAASKLLNFGYTPARRAIYEQAIKETKEAKAIFEELLKEA